MTSNATASQEATHRFTPEEISEFARLSGDYNPLHVDSVAARRTHFGACVVHGVLVLLRSLDLFRTRFPQHVELREIEAKFLRPVLSGNSVTIVAASQSDDKCSLTVLGDGKILMQATVAFSESRTETSTETQPVDGLPPRETPVEHPGSDAGNPSVLPLFWSVGDARRLFPNLIQQSAVSPFATLLASTRIIGMKLPGEHSIYLSLRFSFRDSDQRAEVSYRLAEFRTSSQRMSITVDGPTCTGTLWAVSRPAPVVQLDSISIARRVSRERFADRRVVVIGGSRGLGEIAAKILAAGGAEVAISYRLGQADAERVRNEIREAGGKATTFLLDVDDESTDRILDACCSGFDHAAYFATPPIVDGDGRTLSKTLYTKYNDVYVTGFMRIVQWLANRTAGKFNLFNASSIASEIPPLRNLEYAAAKAAGEACCRWATLAYPAATIRSARFPRLTTDQTASFLSTAEHDNFETIYAELTNWLNT